jgi:hypothetical protein
MLAADLNHALDADAADSRWIGLYRAGGAAAFIGAVFIPIQIIVFIMWPPPSTVIGYFTVFQNNRLVGLLDLDLLMIVQNVLGAVLILALYLALKRTSESIMAIAALLGLVGGAAYFAANPAFNMLFLSANTQPPPPKRRRRYVWPPARRCWPCIMGLPSTRTTFSGPSPCSSSR